MFPLTSIVGALRIRQTFLGEHNKRDTMRWMVRSHKVPKSGGTSHL